MRGQKLILAAVGAVMVATIGTMVALGAAGGGSASTPATEHRDANASSQIALTCAATEHHDANASSQIALHCAATPDAGGCDDIAAMPPELTCEEAQACAAPTILPGCVHPTGEPSVCTYRCFEPMPAPPGATVAPAIAQCVSCAADTVCAMPPPCPAAPGTDTVAPCPARCIEPMLPPSGSGTAPGIERACPPPCTASASCPTPPCDSVLPAPAPGEVQPMIAPACPAPCPPVATPDAGDVAQPGIAPICPPPCPDPAPADETTQCTPPGPICPMFEGGEPAQCPPPPTPCAPAPDPTSNQVAPVPPCPTPYPPDCAISSDGSVACPGAAGGGSGSPGSAPGSSGSGSSGEATAVPGGGQ